MLPITTRSRLIAAAGTALATIGTALAAIGAALAVPSTPATAGPAYTVQTLHFKVLIGPQRDQACDIVGDLYQPRAATATRRVPAILMTNGFGGSKDDQAGWGKYFASHGYALLSYSGLGFGGSTCKITLDDPDYDGVAARQLVSFLGGAKGIAFTDAAHATPAPQLRVVRRDARDHLGHRSSHDPRVGMLGGSYGGGAQFAAASMDPRIDTLVPMITWNDLSYSLDPNGTSQLRPGLQGVSTEMPGAVKLAWGLGFSALGMAQGVQAAQDDWERLLACPNFADWVCPALATAGSTGYFQPEAVAAARHASVGSYLKKIRVPVLLMQGQADTLFNLNEAIATYRALKAQGTPVKMIWQHWGHSGNAKPGEIDSSTPNPTTQYDTARIVAWFAHHLKGQDVSTGPTFAYFRDWVRYTGNARPAYATSRSVDVGHPRTFLMSGSDRLVETTPQVAVGMARLTTPAAGAPAGLTPLDVFGSMTPVPQQEQEQAPGTFAQWSSAPLRAPMTVVGSPKLDFQLSAPSAAGGPFDPSAALVLFVKVLDVAPDGTARTIHGLVSPVRVQYPNERVLVTMPAIVHRFATGHSLQLVISGSDLSYRGGLASHEVTIASGGSQMLTMPVVG